MLDILIIVFAVLFLYQNTQSLMQIPLRDWELVHYALALVSLGLLTVAIWKGVQMYKNHKKKQEKEAEGGEGKEDAEGEDSDEGETQKKKYTYENDDAELAYLDEMDAEEEARKAKQAEGKRIDDEDSEGK
jgi:hypothetical protein